MDANIGSITYASAGHEPSVLVDVDGKIGELKSRGTMLSVKYGLAYKETSCRLNPGDRIVAVTDGITEARNRDVALFGESGLIENSVLLVVP